MRRLLGVLGLLVVLTGCGGGSSTPSPYLTGRWTIPKLYPGVGLTLTMQSSGTRVAGTGTYAIEAGRSGTLQVSGTITGTQFDLNLQYDYLPTPDVYQGQVTDPNHLTGTVHRTGFPDYTLNLTRQ